MDAEFRKLVRQAQAEPTMENLARLGAAYLRSMSPGPQVVTIIGRRWRNSNGNTLHSVDVFLDGEFLGSSDIVYGYGKQYDFTGVDIASQRSNLPPRRQGESTWTWSERVGVKINSSVTDVPRKRDL